MGKIDDTVLKKIQKAELYLLVEFDKVCRKQGLTYFLDSGTALGAIRHGGFIPWDDDIDVGMPRKDYERFMEIGQRLLPSDIFLQNRSTEKNYNRNAAKLRLCGTVFQETNELPYEHNGFFIDIFPFDNLPNNKKIARWNVKMVVEMLHVLRSYRGAEESSSPSRMNRMLYSIVNKFPQSWISRLGAFVTKYARKREFADSRYTTCYYWRMSQSKQYIFDMDEMYPVKDINFEGEKVMIMKNPDYYLNLMYGDYMQLPPVEKRTAHHYDGVLDLGDTKEFFS